MGRSPRAQAWQHLGRKGLPGPRRTRAPVRPPQARRFCLGRDHRPAGAPGPPAPYRPRAARARSALRLLPAPGSRSRSAAERAWASELGGCVSSVSPARRSPAPPRPGPPPHLHARCPGVNAGVQDSDEHPPPVILRVATEEGGGPGLFLGQEAVEGEGLLGDGGGHGRKLEDEEEANCQVARGRAARGHPGGRGPGWG